MEGDVEIHVELSLKVGRAMIEISQKANTLEQRKDWIARTKDARDGAEDAKSNANQLSQRNRERIRDQMRECRNRKGGAIDRIKRSQLDKNQGQIQCGNQ